MNILIQEKNIVASYSITVALKKFYKKPNIVTFVNYFDALKSVNNNNFDLLFIDLVQDKTNNFELIKKIHDTNIKSIVIFTADNTRYAVDAINNRASGLLIKPLNQDDLFSMLRKIELKE